MDFAPIWHTSMGDAVAEDVELGLAHGLSQSSSNHAGSGAAGTPRLGAHPIVQMKLSQFYSVFQFPEPFPEIVSFRATSVIPAGLPGNRF